MSFSWPADFPRIPDGAWTRGPTDPRGLRYDAMGSHRWYRNLDLTVEQLAGTCRVGAIVADLRGHRTPD